MADDQKKLEITQDFLEKHRSNTRKYMHLLSKPNEKPTSIQETLTRIESKFGLSIKRSNSHEVPQIAEKPSENESIQDFIKQIRAKYLSSNDPDQESLNPKPLDPFKSLQNETSELRRNKSEVIPELLGLELSFPTSEENKPGLKPGPVFPTKLDSKSEKNENFERISRKNFSQSEQVASFQGHVQTVQDFTKGAKENRTTTEQLTFDEGDNVLLLSDLVSEPTSNHFSPVSRPPRSKMADEGHEEITKEDVNRSLYENSMSMSFRRVHAEQLLNSAIDDVITNRLKIRKKPQNKPGVFSFETFLNSGKMKFAPLKKVVNFDLVFKNDEVLKGLLWKKEQVMKEIERLEVEKVKVLELMNKV